MAFVPIPNTAKVELIYDTLAQVAENVFHVEFATQPNAAKLVDLAAEVKNWWDVHMQPLTAPGTSLQKIECRDMTTQNGTGIEYTVGLPLAGTATGNEQGNVTVATKFTTGLTGRSYRGRSYLVGLPTSAIGTNPNQITTTFQNALRTAMEELIDAVTVVGGELVVASTVSNGAPRATGVTTAILGVAVDIAIDSMRRRLIGRGN